MGECKKDVTPLLTHWSYVFLALTHRHFPFQTHITPLTVLYSSSSSCNICTCKRSSANCRLVLSWFTTTLFLMFRARFAYFSVFSVSIKSRSDGDTHAIITVRLKAKNYIVCQQRGNWWVIRCNSSALAIESSLSCNSPSKWWYHDMEMRSTLLVLWEGNPLVISRLPSQRTGNQEHCCFFVVSLNKMLNKQSSCSDV